jgi:ribokinase
LPLPDEAGRLADLLVANEHEAAALLRAAGAIVADDAANARALARRFGTRSVVTRGAAGAVAAGPEGGLAIGALPVRAVDTTGAGDAFVGTLAAALDRGATLATALRYASIAGGLACTLRGALPSLPTRARILAALEALAPAVAS